MADPWSQKSGISYKRTLISRNLMQMGPKAAQRAGPWTLSVQPGAGSQSSRGRQEAARIRGAPSLSPGEWRGMEHGHAEGQPPHRPGPAKHSLSRGGTESRGVLDRGALAPSSVLNGFLIHSLTFTKTKRQLLLILRAEEARRSPSRGGTGTGLQSGPTTHGSDRPATLPPGCCIRGPQSPSGEARWRPILLRLLHGTGRVTGVETA